MTTKKIKYSLEDALKEYGPLTFARCLESERLSQELSQKDFAKRLGISQQSLCDIEKGRKIPSPDRAARIAKKLGESPEWWIKVALEDLLRTQHFNYEVTLKKRASGY